MDVGTFRRRTQCRDYMWWIAFLNDNAERERRAIEDAKRGR